MKNEGERLIGDSSCVGRAWTWNPGPLEQRVGVSVCRGGLAMEMVQIVVFDKQHGSQSVLIHPEQALELAEMIKRCASIAA